MKNSASMIGIKFNLLENQRVGRQRNEMSGEVSSGQCKSRLPSKHEDQYKQNRQEEHSKNENVANLET